MNITYELHFENGDVEYYVFNDALSCVNFEESLDDFSLLAFWWKY